MKILTVIAVRGGSKGVKDKNIRSLCGKPLIAHTIEQAKRWGGYDKLIVSTDSKAILDIAVRYGAEAPFIRPPSLAEDCVGKLDVLRHALREAENYYSRQFDALLDLDVTAPIRTIEDIENIVKIFKEKRPDCVFSVVRARRNPYFNMVELRPDSTVKICKESSGAVCRRQDAPPVFALNASLYVYKREFILEESNATPYAKRALLYEMPEVSAVDIDDELDFKFIEFLAREGVVEL